MLNKVWTEDHAGSGGVSSLSARLLLSQEIGRSGASV
jgi:hypothetical protein